jgi:hypothetical protein
MMKKLYFIFLLFPIWGLSSAWAQSVKLLGSNFDTGAVTFTVDVGAATPTWVLVEYTTDPSPTSAIMSRATFTEALCTPPSAGTLAAEGRGFLLTSSATITATLKDVSGRFSWCGYAFNAPPNATVNPEGGYTLHGTPPFTINGNIEVSAGTFGPGTCIESITDFTYNPVGLFPEPPEVTATAAETEICPGAKVVTFTAAASGGTTTAMTYMWDIAGQTYTTASDTYRLGLSELGNATYTVRVTNVNGCTSKVSSTGTVTVTDIRAAGVIETRTVAAILGYPPRTYTPASTVTAVCDNATYEWRRSGTGGDVTLMDSDELAYDIKKDVDAINTPGTYYYRRYASISYFGDQILAPAEGTYTLVVVAPPPSPAGTKTWRATDRNVIWTAAIQVETVTHTVRTPENGYYYTSQRIYDNANKLCPSPWAVPATCLFGEIDYAWMSAEGWLYPAENYLSGQWVSGDLIWGVTYTSSSRRYDCRASPDVQVLHHIPGMTQFQNDLITVRCVAAYNY